MKNLDEASTLAVLEQAVEKTATANKTERLSKVIGNLIDISLAPCNQSVESAFKLSGSEI